MRTVPVWPGCNNNCVMCTNERSLRRMSRWPFSLYKLKEHLRGVKADAFLLSGGEPTLNNYLVPFVVWLQQKYRGSQLTLLTNGRKFASGAYAQRFLRAAPTAHLAVSLPAATPALHDAVTRVPGSFMETARGLANIAALKSAQQRLEVRIVLTRLNVSGVGATVKWLLKNIPGIAQITLIYPEYEGAMAANAAGTGLSYGECAHALAAAARAAKNFDGLRLYHFALCALDNELRPLARRSLGDAEMRRGPGCEKCKLLEDCGGVPVFALSGNPGFVCTPPLDGATASGVKKNARAGRRHGKSGL